MNQIAPDKKNLVKTIFLTIICLLIVAMIVCFWIGEAMVGSALGFVLLAILSPLYRLYGNENSVYVNKYGHDTDYDRSKLPKDF